MSKKRNQKKPELETLQPQLGGCCDNSSETWRQPGLAWGCGSRNGINGMLQVNTENLKLSGLADLLGSGQ